MPDYIDREKLIKSIENDCPEQVYYTKEDAIDCIKSATSENVAPVVHAIWVWNPNGMDFGLGAWQCGRCFARNNNLPINSKINPMMCIGSKYCPECGVKIKGAKMDADKEEQTT